ncbi:MAG: molybdopterin converting factor subunit 1 [Rhodocyclaceae bacterium]|nr:molybdopterin converting factor subunit 1 [Rhodocyclaceae bacterium]
MSTTVLFFAGLREAVGTSSFSFDLPPEVNTVGALREHLAAGSDRWSALTRTTNLRAAVNQLMVDMNAAVTDGDEVAFFPPVTGG